MSKADEKREKVELVKVGDDKDTDSDADDSAPGTVRTKHVEQYARIQSLLPDCRKELLERFEAFQKAPDANGCRKWNGKLNTAGYGTFTYYVNGAGKQHLIKHHVFAYIIHVGPVPSGQCVRHTCNVRSCSEKTHLIPGTSVDNKADTVLAGTHRTGERHPRATITLEKATLIKHSRGNGSMAERARRFGVNREIVRSIDRNIAWANIPDAQGVVHPSRQKLKRRKLSDDHQFSRSAYDRSWSKMSASAKTQACAGFEKPCMRCQIGLNRESGKSSTCIDGHSRASHHISWERNVNNYVRPAADDKLVIYRKCGVANCIEPSHLDRATPSKMRHYRNAKRRKLEPDSS